MFTSGIISVIRDGADLRITLTNEALVFLSAIGTEGVFSVTISEDDLENVGLDFGEYITREDERSEFDK